ncbi:TIM barrel protein [Dactylosporangium sp. NPDC051484]|uniref:hydroxypyruvate isomerase family protein n=1 Tax=Dactylosporangium sp. NPDC051484 TaxID=3154942 RepID=UPI00344B4F90
MDLSAYVVNCSILFGSLPLPERLARVRAAGGRAVEFWWPFESAHPDDAEINTFIDALHDAEVDLAGLNLFAGDMAGGDRGVLSWPGREHELHASVDVARRVQEATGCGIFNALYGRRLPKVPPAVQAESALANLAYATSQLAELGGTVVLEAVSGVPDYPLKTASDVVAVLMDAERREVENAGLLLDVYHLSVNGDDVDQAIDQYAARIAHVQLADAPGRGIPGSGTLPFDRWLEALDAAGYRGRIALEFQSTADNPFAPEQRRDS